MHERWATGLAVLVVLGCDPAEPKPKPERERDREEKTPVAAKSETPEKTPEPSEDAIPITVPGKSSQTGSGGGGESAGSVGTDASISGTFGPGSSLPDCLSGCEARGLSQDNKSTCRLLCKSHYAGAVDKGVLVDAYVGCFDACEGQASCRKRCSSEAGRGDSCTMTCFDAFGRCLSPCDGGSDPGRCAEKCETTARTCAGAC